MDVHILLFVIRRKGAEYVLLCDVFIEWVNQTEQMCFSFAWRIFFPHFHSLFWREIWKYIHTQTKQPVTIGVLNGWKIAKELHKNGNNECTPTTTQESPKRRRHNKFKPIISSLAHKITKRLRVCACDFVFSIVLLSESVSLYLTMSLITQEWNTQRQRDRVREK